MPNLSNGFDKLAHWTARHAGRASTFALALTTFLVWGISGPTFGWSDTWQLVINTATTIVTFLMVFLIQNTQNRDTEAIQLKLDELIRVNTKARNSLLQLEELTEEEITHIKKTFTTLQRPAHRSRRKEKQPGKNRGCCPTLRRASGTHAHQQNEETRPHTRRLVTLDLLTWIEPSFSHRRSQTPPTCTSEGAARRAALIRMSTSRASRTSPAAARSQCRGTGRG
jgi:low affinity Fe/Cu permease